jgi:hypothetical protein
MPPASVENKFENAKHHQPCRNTVYRHQLITRLKLGWEEETPARARRPRRIPPLPTMLMGLPNKESICFFHLRGGRGDTPRTPRFKNYYLFFLTIQGGESKKKLITKERKDENTKKRKDKFRAL